MSQSWKEVKGCAEVTMGLTDVKDVEQDRMKTWWNSKMLDEVKGMMSNAEWRC